MLSKLTYSVKFSTLSIWWVKWFETRALCQNWHQIWLMSHLCTQCTALESDHNGNKCTDHCDEFDHNGGNDDTYHDDHVDWNDLNTIWAISHHPQKILLTFTLATSPTLRVLTLHFLIQWLNSSPLSSIVSVISLSRLYSLAAEIELWERGN